MRCHPENRKRPRNSSRRAALLALFVAVVAAAGCSRGPETPGVCEIAAQRGAVASGDSILLGSIGDASNLIPMRAGDSASHEVAGRIFDGMLAYDRDLGGLEPRLAERWEVSEDGREITFYLRKDVRWQDGEPFTARDVEFGFNTITDPATLTAHAEDYLQVSRFAVIDDHTFRVTYDKPYAPALATWGSMVVLPRHLLEGQNINEATEFARNPVGLGSYKLESWETKRQITVLANDDYYRGRPHIDRVVTRILPDQQTQFLELKSGGLDMMGLTPLQFTRQTETADFTRNIRKFNYLGNGYTYLGYNLQREPFTDVRVRRALTHAIDKNEIVSAVLLGRGQPAVSPYKPGTRWFNDRVNDPQYDPEKARALLAEAGWTDSDGDGILDKDGKPFRFEIITNNGNEQRAKTATIIQRRLREIGVVVEVRTIEWAAFINDFVDKKNFDAVVLGWSLDPDPDQYIIWHSSKTEPKQFNFISFDNAEVDALLEAGRRTFDADERKKAYDRFQEILVEEQPYTFLYYPESLPALHCRFQGIEPAAAGIAYNFKDWYVPQSLQKYAMTASP